MTCIKISYIIGSMLPENDRNVGGDFSDWRDGRIVSTRVRNKLILATGIGSTSGDASEKFGFLLRNFRESMGYDRGDFLEVSYLCSNFGGERRPVPYQAGHCNERSIAESVYNVANVLRWYRSKLPQQRLHLIGYSLGGVVLFESAARLMEKNPEHWRGHIASFTTFRGRSGASNNFWGACGCLSYSRR